MQNFFMTFTSWRLLSTSQLIKSTFLSSFCSWNFSFRTIFMSSSNLRVQNIIYNSNYQFSSPRLLLFCIKLEMRRGQYLVLKVKLCNFLVKIHYLWINLLPKIKVYNSLLAVGKHCLLQNNFNLKKYNISNMPSQLWYLWSMLYWDHWGSKINFNNFKNYC